MSIFIFSILLFCILFRSPVSMSSPLNPLLVALAAGSDVGDLILVTLKNVSDLFVSYCLLGFNQISFAFLYLIDKAQTLSSSCCVSKLIIAKLLFFPKMEHLRIKQVLALRFLSF